MTTMKRLIGSAAAKIAALTLGCAALCASTVHAAGFDGKSLTTNDWFDVGFTGVAADTVIAKDSATGITLGAGSWTAVPTSGEAVVLSDKTLSIDADPDEALTLTPVASSATGMETVAVKIKANVSASLEAPADSPITAFSLYNDGTTVKPAVYVSGGWKYLVYANIADLTNGWFTLYIDYADVDNVKSVRFSVQPDGGAITVLKDSQDATWFTSASSATKVSSLSFSGSGLCQTISGDTHQSAVAQVNGVNYATFADAIAALQDGDTIIVLDSTLSAPEGWEFATDSGTGVTTLVESDPYAYLGTKVADGFYQNAATYAASTDFYITNLNGLKYFRDLVNGDETVCAGYPELPRNRTIHAFSGKFVHLLADIDLDNEPWEPIGHPYQTIERLQFEGSFDGGIYDAEGNLIGAHTISNLNVSIASGKYYAGLFGVYHASANSTLKNLILDGVTISSGQSTQGVGAFVGSAKNAQAGVTLENLRVVGNISITGNTSYVGGIVGDGRCTIRNCSVSAVGTIKGTYAVGGIVGGLLPNSTGVYDCAVTNATVQTTAYNYGLGALVGFSRALSVSNCTASAVTVVCNVSSYAGSGLVGLLVGYSDGAPGYTILSDNTVVNTTATEYNTAVTTHIGVENADYTIVGANIAYDGSGKINGGVFQSIPAAVIADGLTRIPNTDQATSAEYPYTVGIPPVAQIGDDTYETLAAAIAAARTNGGTIVLLADIDEAGGNAKGYDMSGITLDGQGHTISCASGVLFSGTNVVVSNLKVEMGASSGHIMTVNSGTFTGCEFVGASGVKSANYADDKSGVAKTLTFSNCTFRDFTTDTAVINVDETDVNSRLVVDHCTFSNTVRVTILQRADMFTNNTITDFDKFTVNNSNVVVSNNTFDKGARNGVMNFYNKPAEITGNDFSTAGEFKNKGTSILTAEDPLNLVNNTWGDYDKSSLPVGIIAEFPAYDVWVGGTLINEGNAADVFGDGKVSYDDATKTLTLNGYTYSGAGYENSAIYAADDISVVVQGENSLTLTAGYGIYAGGTIAVTGAGVDPTLNITASTNVLVVGENAAFTNLAMAASGVRGIVLNGSDEADAVILNGCTATFASGMAAAIWVYNETGHGTVSIVNGSELSGYGQISAYGKGSSYGDAALTVKDSVVELEVPDSAGAPRPGHCLEVLSYHGDAFLLISNSTVTVNAKNNADAVNVGAQNTSNGKGKCKVDIIDSTVEGVGKRCGLTAFTWDDTGANVYGTSVNIINSDVSVEGQGDSGFNVYAYAKGCTSFYVTNSTVEATAPDTAINLRPGYYKDAALIGSITYTQIDSDVTATASDYYGLCVSAYSAGRGNYSATNKVMISGGSFTSYGMVCCENDAANSEIVVTDDAEVYVDVSGISYYYYTFDLSSILSIDSGKNAFDYKDGAGIAPSTVVGNITGGIFSEDVSDLCAAGYVCTENTDAETSEDYPYAVVPAVASITVDAGTDEEETVYFATFDDAIDAALDDQTIVVINYNDQMVAPEGWKFSTDVSVVPPVTTLVRTVSVEVTFELGDNPPENAVIPSPGSYAAGSALPSATCPDTNTSFAGWKVKNSDPELVISALPLDATGFITLVATWIGTKTVTVTESETSVSINVTDEWIADKVTIAPDASPAETNAAVEAALNTKDSNGLPAWQNYVLGQDPNANVAAGAEQGAVDAMPVVSTVTPQTVDTGFKVEYRLDAVDTNGNVVASTEAQATPDLTVDLTKLTSENNVAYYKTVAVITSTTDPNVTVTVPSTNTIGVLKVESGAKTTAVAVPWASYDGTNDISVADIVRTANLTLGDELKAYAPDGSGYKAWELDANKVWQPIKVAGGSSESEADAFKVKRGSAVWLTRADPSQPIYLVGGVAATEKVSVALEPKKGENDPSWNLVGSAGTEPVKVSEIAAATDKIVVPTAYIPKEYEYVDGKGWGYWDYVTEIKQPSGRKTVKKVWKAAEDIPAGTGFWYLNGGGEKDINL